MIENKEKINEFYIKFKVRDYIENNFQELPKDVIDCSLGVNPFEKNDNAYPDIQYKKLKRCLLKKLELNDIVLGYSPQFPRVISEIELKKAKYEYYELKEDCKFIADEFINKIDGNQKAIYIDNPNNPTQDRL